MENLIGSAGFADAANAAGGAEAAAAAESEFSEAMNNGMMQVGSFVFQFISQDVIEEVMKEDPASVS